MEGSPTVSDLRIGEGPFCREVRFICTDRRNHPSREILLVSRDIETGELAQIGTSQGSHRNTYRLTSALAETPEGTIGRADWNFPPCPTCGRSPRRSSENMRDLVEGILSTSNASPVSFDASYID